MTSHGTLVALFSIGLLFAFVLRLTLMGRLYIGYAALWVLCLAAGGALLAAPPLLRFVTTAVGAVFPVSAITFLSLIGIFLVLIYFSCQLTILSNRVTAIAQHIALSEIHGVDASAITEDESSGS